jgi:hypothetical protein
MCLAAGMFTALSPVPILNIAHNASSHSNPALLRTLADDALAYTDYHPYHRSLFPGYIRDCPTQMEYNVFTTLFETIPAHLFAASAKLPSPIGGPQNRKTARMLMDINAKMAGLAKVFAFFINNGWVYESKITEVWVSQMSPEDRQEFQFDPKTINWKELHARFAYGIRKYVI